MDVGAFAPELADTLAVPADDVTTARQLPQISALDAEFFRKIGKEYSGVARALERERRVSYVVIGSTLRKRRTI